MAPLEPQLRKKRNTNSIRLADPKRRTPEPKYTHKWPLRLRHADLIKPATRPRWIDEYRWPHLVDAFLKYANDDETHTFPDSDPEDPDFKPSDKIRRETPVDPTKMVETNDFPEAPSPIDLNSWDLEVRPLPHHQYHLTRPLSRPKHQKNSTTQQTTGLLAKCVSSVQFLEHQRNQTAWDKMMREILEMANYAELLDQAKDRPSTGGETPTPKALQTGLLCCLSGTMTSPSDQEQEREQAHQDCLGHSYHTRQKHLHVLEISNICIS